MLTLPQPRTLHTNHFFNINQCRILLCIGPPCKDFVGRSMANVRYKMVFSYQFKGEEHECSFFSFFFVIVLLIIYLMFQLKHEWNEEISYFNFQMFAFKLNQV